MKNTLFLTVTLILTLTGCSQKCMNNQYECTPAENFISDVISGATNTAEFINNKTQFMKYK